MTGNDKEIKAQRLPKHYERVDQAMQESIEGAIVGGLKGLAFGVVTSFTAQKFWKSYRQLTIPYKVFLLLSSVLAFGCVEADKRLVAFEKQVTREERIRRAKALNDAAEKGVYIGPEI